MDDKKKRFDFSQGAAEAPHVIDAASVLGNRSRLASPPLFLEGVNVIALTKESFKKEVLYYEGVVIVGFSASWCAHCKSLVPEYQKPATALKGLAKIASVDATQHQSFADEFGVQRYPTLKVFGADKMKHTDYRGAHTAQAIVDFVLSEIKAIASKRLESSSSSSGGFRGGSEEKNAVIELTDANFDNIVFNSKEGVLVEFFAPLHGHCKNLEPHYKAAATEMKGKVKFAALDATVHQQKACLLGIKGFPTIKYFAPGSTSASDAVDYEGGRSADIIQFATAKAAENLPPPELKELINKATFDEACKGKQLCVITFLPPICHVKCRLEYIKLLKELKIRFKKNSWGWVWTEAGQQPKIEQYVAIGGYGYPAMVAVNLKFKKSGYPVYFQKLPFREAFLINFLKKLSLGDLEPTSARYKQLPKPQTIQAWDGKDAELLEEEEIDLSDVNLDDTNAN